MSAAAVRAAVVLGLRLRVEPRLHGGPLVRRVAAAAASASCRPTWERTKAAALRGSFCTLPLPPHPLQARAHTQTRTTQKFLPKPQKQSYSRSSWDPRATAGSVLGPQHDTPQSPEQSASRLQQGIVILPGIQVGLDLSRRDRDFSGLISCTVRSAKIGEKPLVRK